MRFALIGVLVLAGCTDSPAARLRAAYPEHAEEILAGTEQVDVPRANGMRMERLRQGEVRFATADGFSIEVDEVAPATTFWTATPHGFEEWLLVDPPTSGPIATWSVRGGRLARRGADVVVVNSSGRPAVVVRAPEAYAGKHKPSLHFEIDGNQLALYAVLRGDVHAGPWLIDPIWKPVSAPGVFRSRHTATLLPSGKVLVAGNESGNSTAELYDPALDTWTDAGQMLSPRWDHTATLLANGKVLLAFGVSRPGTLTATPWAEIYDPTTGLFADAGSWYPVFAHSATRLPNGDVMFVGGSDHAGIYSVASGTWRDLPSVPISNWSHFWQTLTPLEDGRLLLTSGVHPGFDLFDPITETWAPASPSSTLTFRHAMFRLPDGRLLKVGGESNPSFPPASAEIYDPASNTWTVTNRPACTHDFSGGVLLPSGDALLVGGFCNDGRAVSRYFVDAGVWRDGGALHDHMLMNTATLLPNGMVLAVGGVFTATDGGAELFDPTFGQPCASGADCLTGVCADGVCCESQCLGNCASCSQAGTEGVCVLFDAGAPGAPSCSPYLCNGLSNACPSTCATANDCAPGTYCSGSSCLPQKPTGAICMTPPECASAHCVDGFCCNTNCGNGDSTDCLSCANDAGICGAAPSTTVCRPPVVACDAPEFCTGADPACPSDQGKPPGTICRASVGFCDPAEVCDGFVTQCPVDARAPVTTICRLAAGTCDVTETCDGTSATCPPDVFIDAGFVCRPVGGVCDAEEACAGDSALCPADRAAPDGTTCIKGGTCIAGDCKEKVPVVKDAGPTMPADAGPDPKPETPRGCGCGSTDGVFALALLAFARRRRVLAALQPSSSVQPLPER